MMGKVLSLAVPEKEATSASHILRRALEENFEEAIVFGFRNHELWVLKNGGAASRHEMMGLLADALHELGNG